MSRAAPSSAGRTEESAERWVSVEEVAAHVGVRKDSIYRWIESRGLPATKIGKLWKLRLSEVDAWIRAGGDGARGDGAVTRRARLAEPESSERASAPTSHTSTVLVVDDDDDIREILRDVVADQGYAVRTASDGLEALSVLRESEPPRVDLILLDLNMPRMDGLAFLAEQKRDPIIAAIPVIIITAEQLLRAPDAPVLQKPLDVTKVLDSIRRLVAR